MSSLEKTLLELKEDFDLFESSEEKLEYIFDLGKEHTTLPKDEKNDDTFIEGCASPAWLTGECKDGKVHLRGEGTSEMAKGMIVLLLKIFNDRGPDEILSFNPQRLNDLGIVELLSPVRQKSLQAFLEKVYAYAKKCKEEANGK